MRRAGIVGAAGLCLALSSTGPEPASLQRESGPIVMRSRNSAELQWWIVDPKTGMAAFYGGDIIALCKDDPSGYDLLDLTEVRVADDVGRHNLIGQGKNIRASLWKSAPPFVVPRLCQDILSRGAPMATGTADLTFAGSFVDPNPPRSSQGMYGMTAQGTMRGADGSEMRVNAHYRCTYNTDAPAEARCTQGVVLNR